MNQQKSLLIIILTFVITAAIIGSGMYWWQSLKIASLQTQLTAANVVPQRSPFKLAVKYNCEQSGGVFSQSKCQCQKDPEPANTTNYDEGTGYCMDSFGIPGGEQGKISKKLQELQMLKVASSDDLLSLISQYHPIKTDTIASAFGSAEIKLNKTNDGFDVKVYVDGLGDDVTRGEKYAMKIVSQDGSYKVINDKLIESINWPGRN